MSGGAHEYVMGNIGTSAGQTAGEYNYYASYAGGNYVYTGFEKYLTTYAYGTTYNDQMAYNRGRLGDATSEVLLTIGDSWYGDSNGFPLDDEAWFIRGGNYYNNTRAGIFSFSMTIGGGIVATGSRAALSCVAS